jgi:hypothetical protein
MQSLLHPELTRTLAADAARRGPRISRSEPRVALWRRARPRLSGRIGLASAKGA